MNTDLVYTDVVKTDPPSDTGSIVEVHQQVSGDVWVVHAMFNSLEDVMLILEYPNPRVGQKIDVWVDSVDTIRGYAVDEKIITLVKPNEFENKTIDESLQMIWDKNKDDVEYDIEVEERLTALTPEFQDRIRGLDSRSKWAHYTTLMFEIWVCEEAEKLIKVTKTLDGIIAWAALPRELRLSMSNLDTLRHTSQSLNSVGELVFSYFFDQSVAREHAASCHHIGCKRAGCWSTTDEAKQIIKESESDAHARQSEIRNGESENGTNRNQSQYNA